MSMAPVGGAGGLQKAAGKRCGTCIDRKIRCDRGVPACSNCVRSGRTCLGYGLRLSWPRDDDHRRLIIGPVPQNERRGRCRMKYYPIHATFWDFDTYARLSSPHSQKRCPFPVLTYKTLPWTQSHVTVEQQELFQYFTLNLAGAFTTFSEEPLGDILIRLALCDNSNACMAVLHASLALSYLSRYGPGVQADQFKLAAIRSLLASSKDGVSVENGPQHIAAGLLLSSYEIINLRTALSDQWMWYTRGVEIVISNLEAELNCNCGQWLYGLLDWAYHHNVTSRFSLRHWRPQSQDAGEIRPYSLPVYSSTPPESRMMRCPSLRARNKPLAFLDDVCSFVLSPSDPRGNTPEYQESLTKLEREIESFTHPTTIDMNLPIMEQDYQAIMDELHGISILIYLMRASNRHAKDPEKFTSCVNRGFSILTGVDACRRLLPVLIIGIEARNDEERVSIMEVISKSEAKCHVGGRLEYARAVLHGVWTHDDLHAEDSTEANYVEKITMVMSASGVLLPWT